MHYLNRASVSLAELTTTASDVVIIQSDVKTTLSNLVVAKSDILTNLSNLVLTNAIVDTVASDLVITQSDCKTILSNLIALSDIITLQSNLTVTNAIVDTIASDVVINLSDCKTILSNLVLTNAIVDTIASDLVISQSDIKSNLSNLVLTNAIVDTIASDLLITHSDVKTVLSNLIALSDIITVQSNLTIARSDLSALALRSGQGGMVSTSVTHDGTASYTVFTVTGCVACKVIGYVTTALTNHADTTSIGTATTVDGLIAATAGTAMQTVGQAWVDNAPSKFEVFPTAMAIIGNGEDIAVDGSANITGGVVELYCFYVPLSSDGAVTAT